MFLVWMSLGSIFLPMTFSLVPVSYQDGNDSGMQRFSQLVIITKYQEFNWYCNFHANRGGSFIPCIHLYTGPTLVRSSVGLILSFSNTIRVFITRVSHFWMSVGCGYSENIFDFDTIDFIYHSRTFKPK